MALGSKALDMPWSRFMRACFFLLEGGGGPATCGLAGARRPAYGDLYYLASAHRPPILALGLALLDGLAGHRPGASEEARVDDCRECERDPGPEPEAERRHRD